MPNRRSTTIATYRCPSDPSPSDVYKVVDGCGGSGNVLATFSLSNYVFNTGQAETWSDPGDLSQLASGPFYRNSRTRMSDVTDGLTNTVFLGEQTTYHTLGATWVGIVPGSQTCPTARFAYASSDEAAPQCSVHSGPGGPFEIPPVIHPPNSTLGLVDEMYSMHPGGCHVLLGDGSVRFASQSMDQQVWSFLATRNGGEVVGEW